MSAYDAYEYDSLTGNIAPYSADLYHSLHEKLRFVIDKLPEVTKYHEFTGNMPVFSFELFREIFPEEAHPEDSQYIPSDLERKIDPQTKCTFYVSSSKLRSLWYPAELKPHHTELIPRYTNQLSVFERKYGPPPPKLEHPPPHNPNNLTGWEQVYDRKSQSNFYYNTITGSSQWSEPRSMKKRGEGGSSGAATPLKGSAAGDSASVGSGSAPAMNPVSSSPVPTNAQVIPTASTRSRSKYGMLWKKGAGSSFFGRRNWKDRYFVLEGKTLRYYTDESSFLRGDDPIKNKWITLADYELWDMRGSRNMLKLIPLSGGRDYVIRANTLQDKESWIESFRHHVKEIKVGDDPKDHKKRG